jgi:hypothetical protein
MKRFICFSPSKEHFNAAGQSLGMGDDRALFYSPSVGRQRLYRSSYPDPTKGLKLLTFKTESVAQSRCNSINKAYNDDFSTLEIDVESPKKLITT